MKDMMPSFNLVQPTDVESAISILADAGANGWAMAGGQDSLDWFKDRVKRPQTVVDLSGIESLKGIRETADGGVEIGAMTTLTDIENNAIIKEKYGLLSMAAGRVASPQIRNKGTLGGNISQDTRCWYYRSGLDCYRAGGNTCYADTPEGMNREHCLFGASRCVAVTPSDTAVAITTLEASMVIVGPGGERVVPASEYFIGPAIDIERMTVLEPGDVLTAIRIPAKWSGAQFYFEKVADRATWDFPLVNIASAMKVSGGVIEDISLTCGAVECVPKRLTVVEDIVRGSAPDEETANLGAGAASRGASPLNYNHFKVPLMENLVKRAIRG
jgi:xanthine dehydrogenase YagS FAD-binding subunit|tara:strand:- start:48002 stop:48988 length:987 start_codon:yes stop_codon:yes gene_type:complete